MEKKNLIDIFRGPTFKGGLSFAGLVLLIAGIVLLSLGYLWIMSVLFILTGLSLFINLQGTLIDFENGVVHSYMYLLAFKVGSSYDLKDYNKADVSLFKESIKMNSRGTSGEYNTKEYFVSLVSQTKDKILLKSFLKKEDAFKFKDMLDELLVNRIN